jgi:hypothetical protein
MSSNIKPKQEKIEITLYTNLEPVYGSRGGRLPPESILRKANKEKKQLTHSDPPRYRGLLEQLIMMMKADKFSFRHYYDDGTVKDFVSWE